MRTNTRITWPTICIFGDSIVRGGNDSQGGWVARLQRHFLKRPEIYNLGVSGDTADLISQRFDAEAAARNPRAIVIAAGVNHCPGIHGMPDTWLEDFRKSYDELVQKALQVTGKVLVLEVTSVDEATQTDDFAKDSEVQQLNQAIQAIAQKYRTELLVTYDLLSATDLADGLHPNDYGHEKLFEAALNKLVALGWDKL